MDILSGLVVTLAVAATGPADTLHVAQLTIREQIIVRVPARRAPPPASIWRERGHDRCVRLANLAAAAVMQADAVDFLLKGGKRVRAYVERSCPALDYYSGFYMLPTEDGRVCANRDAIHDRSGSACGITRFRTLAPRGKRR